MDITQTGILVFGPVAIFLVSCRKESLRKWGYVAGFASQPFWIWTAVEHRQWGILVLSLVYTVSWAHGIYNFWGAGSEINSSKLEKRI